MIRTTLKYPILHLTRVTPNRPILRHEIKVYQSTLSSGGGRGRGLVLTIGALTVAATGTAVYAKYDSSFRKLLEDNVPFSDTVLGVTTDLIDQITNLTRVTQEKTTVMQVTKEKASALDPSPPVKIVQKEETKLKPVSKEEPKAVHPAEDSLLKKKLERDAIEVATRTIVNLNKELESSVSLAVSTCKQAASLLQGLATELSLHGSLELNDKELAELMARSQESDTSAKKAVNANLDAKKNIENLKKVLSSSKLPPSSDAAKLAHQSLIACEKQLHESEMALNEATKNVKSSQVLQVKISDAYKKLEEELGPGWDKKRDNDLFLILIAMKLLQYKSNLNKQSKLEEQRLHETLEARGEEGIEERVQAHLKAKEEELRQLIENEYKMQLATIRDEGERREQFQLHQQALVMDDEKNLALSNQKLAFSRELSERIGQQSLQHKEQVGAVVECLQGSQANLNAREIAIKEGAELLAMATTCDTLLRALNTNPHPALDWTHQRQSLNDHIAAVKRVFSCNDEFVNATLSMIPPTAMKQGVLTESALKQRFNKVEQVARNVSMITEKDNNSLILYILSYLRAALLILPVTAIKPHEVANEPIDFSQLENNAVLDRARYFVDKGDLMQALRYLNLLQGPAQFAASGWVEEARQLLEVQQIVQTLAAYASLLVQNSIKKELP